MKRTKLLAILVIAAMVIVPLFATAAMAKKYEIAVVVKIAGIPWFNRMAEGVKQAGKELGVKAYLIGPSTADPAPQVQMVENPITRGVDAICVVPNDAKALAPAFKKARKKGIVVLTHESPFETKSADWDIEMIDNVTYGKLAINEIVRNIVNQGEKFTVKKPCGFVMLVGSLTVPLHNFWADVALKYAKKYFPFLKELTSRLPTAESVTDSRKAVLDLITTYGNKLGAIIGWGSLGPIGAAQAVTEKGLQNKIIVVGSAIPSTTIPYFKSGAIDSAQLWDPKEAGYAMVYIANMILNHKKIAIGEKIPHLGPMHVKGKIIYFNQIKIMRSAKDAEALGF